MTSALSLDQLQQLMIECMGASAVPVLHTPEFADSSFDDLDFDSLARIELTEQLREWSGNTLPDDIVDQSPTPRDLCDRVNAELDGTAAPTAAER